MAEISFESILDMAASDIEQPKPLPEGTYLMMVKGVPERVQVGPNKEFEAVDFTLQYIQADKDVNPQALDEALNGHPLPEKTFRYRRFVNDERSVYHLKQLVYKHLGIDDAGGKKTLRQAFGEAPGKQLYVKFRHKVNKEDPSAVYPEIERTLPV